MAFGRSKTALALLVPALVLASSGSWVQAADCTDSEIDTIMQLNATAGNSACTETALSIEEYCSNTDCLDTLKEILSELPDCEYFGINIQTSVRTSLSLCDEDVSSGTSTTTATSDSSDSSSSTSSTSSTSGGLTTGGTTSTTDSSSSKTSTKDSSSSKSSTTSSSSSDSAECSTSQTTTIQTALEKAQTASECSSTTVPTSATSTSDLCKSIPSDCLDYLSDLTSDLPDCAVSGFNTKSYFESMLKECGSNSATTTVLGAAALIANVVVVLML